MAAILTHLSFLIVVAPGLTGWAGGAKDNPEIMILAAMPRG
jgi:hypothetical protein